MANRVALLLGSLALSGCGGEAPSAPTAAAAPPAAVELQVTGFQLRDAQGNLNPRGNHYRRGRIPWWLKLAGLTVDGGMHRIGIKTRIRAEDGRVMFESKQYNVVEQAAPTTGDAHRGELSNVANIPALGTFTLELQLRDEPSGNETTMAEKVVIED